MKRVKYIILFIFIFICIGCSYKYGSSIRNIRHSGFNLSKSEFVCDVIATEDEIKDPVKFYVGNYLITESGNIYETNLSKVYSNDMNCKKPDFDVSIKAIFDLSILKGTDNKYYYVGGTNNVAAFSEVSTNDEDYVLYDLLLKEDDVLKASTINAKDGTYYVLKEDGNIYQYTIIKENEVYKLINSFLLYDSSDYDSKILDFNYNGSSTTTFVKTEKSYYRMQVTNSEECYKYADVACKYEMLKDEKLTEEKDRIMAYSGSTLITNYGRVFNVNN